MKTPKTAGTTLSYKILEAQNATTIIGIDPGLQNLGIGIIKIKPDKEIEYSLGKKNKKIFCNKKIKKIIIGYEYILIKLKQNRTIAEKLFYIFEELNKIFEDQKPKLIMVEDAFVGINKNSGLKLGIVRGCIITAIGKHKLNFETIAPRQIKMEFTNSGNAQKEDIQKEFANLLPKWPTDIKFDCSDALAAAFCGIKLIAKHKESTPLQAAAVNKAQ